MHLVFDGFFSEKNKCVRILRMCVYVKYVPNLIQLPVNPVYREEV